MMEDFDQESILDEFSNRIKNKEGECPGSRTKVDFEQQVVILNSSITSLFICQFKSYRKNNE